MEETMNRTIDIPPAGRVRALRTTLAVLLAAAFALSCSTVPVTGRQSFNIVPDSQADALGADSYRQVLAASKVVSSGPDRERVLRVGQRIAAVSDAPGFAWEFNLLDEPKTVNAFCLPGGKVAVYSGILPVTQDDTGLAVVVAHEIAHAIARHGSERMTDQLALQIGQLGLTELLGRKSPQTQSLVLAAFGAGAQVGILLPFSRAQESEADHIGLVYMARAGYDPREAPKFWERMAAQSTGGRPPEFLSTHPAPEARIRQIEALIPEAMKEYRPR
jgi:predicted Zn-dependent protease